MGINPARSAAIRVLGSGCFSHFGVLALERNTKLNLRRRPKQVYWSSEQFGKIGRHAQMGRRKYKSLLAVRPVEVPRTLRDYSSSSPEFEG